MRDGLNTAMKGDPIAGYALVVWHMNGTFSTAHWAARGPIGRSMVPAIVHDALQQRISAIVAIDTLEDDNRIPVK